MVRRTKYNEINKQMQNRRFTENISTEYKMIYDGLEGLLSKLKETNKGNNKLFILVDNIIETSFKLGYLASRKDKFKELSEEEYQKEMLL